MTTTGDTAPPTFASFARLFGPPRLRWWIWVAVTCSAVSAHLVALGTSVAWWGVICVTILITAPLSGWMTHGRAWAMILGVFAALWVVLLLETYLGWTGLYYGPIGSPGRPFPNVDKDVCRVLLCFYRNSTLVKAIVSPILSIIVYFLLVRCVANQWVNRLGHFIAWLGMAVTVLLWLPFTNGLDSGQVAFSKAVLDASGANKTLGSYREAVDTLAKEVNSLQRIAAALQVRPRPKPDPLLDRIAAYAKLLATARQAGQSRNDILRRAPDQYHEEDDLAELRTPARPLQPDMVFAQKPGSLRDSDLGGDSVVDHEALQKAATKMLDDGMKLQEERARLIAEIRKIVGQEIHDSLGNDWDQALADEIMMQVMQTLVSAEAGQAGEALASQIARLQTAVQQREADSRALRTKVEQYEDGLVAVARNDSACSAVIASVLTYLRSAEGTDLFQRISRNRERARRLFDPRAVPGKEVSPPPIPDSALNIGTVRREVTDRLTKEGIVPPQFDWTYLRQEVSSMTRDDNVPSIIDPFVESACRRGQTSEQIIAALNRASTSLNVPPG